jgi:hypothetical protein
MQLPRQLTSEAEHPQLTSLVVAGTPAEAVVDKRSAN